MSFFRPPKQSSPPPAPVAPIEMPEPLPPPPERSAEDTSALVAEQRSKFFRRRGRASTMLTGGPGVDVNNSAAAVRFLGSAAKT